MAHATPHRLTEQDAPVPVTDRRRHRRIKLDLNGRFMRADQTEHRCRLMDISISGAALASPVPVRPGEHLVCYLDEIGRIEGPVYRIIPGGFVLTIQASQRARERLAATMMWLANRDFLGADVELRRPGHERMAVSNKMTQIVLDDSTAIAAQVIDISISGASVATDTRPPVGTELWLGRMRAKVVRHHESGLAVTFVGQPAPAEINHALGMIS
jgi:hypothetical protein